MESASPNASDKEELVTQDILEGAIHGNDWRALNPAEIGEGEFVDRVTVILPCYMGQQELSLTFAGLSRQTYPNHLIEVIVVDDGSDPPIKLPSQLPFETLVVVRTYRLCLQRSSGIYVVYICTTFCVHVHVYMYNIHNCAYMLYFYAILA